MQQELIGTPFFLLLIDQPRIVQLNLVPFTYYMGERLIYLPQRARKPKFHQKFQILILFKGWKILLPACLRLIRQYTLTVKYHISSTKLTTTGKLGKDVLRLMILCICFAQRRKLE
jgi:hypothetical protein